MKRNEILFFRPIKQTYAKEPMLNTSYVKKQQEAGKIVQIILDNCCIQRMELLPSNPTIKDAENVGLLPLIEILNTCPVLLSPIGLIEMPDSHIKFAEESYRRFCDTFWPNHKDDANQINITPMTLNNKKDFHSYDLGGKIAIGKSYIPMLTIQLINTKFSNLSPEEKFNAYLQSLTLNIDIISAFELEIAKYAFWEISKEEFNTLPNDILQRRKDLKANFFKSFESYENCKKFAFNASMDLVWILTASANNFFNTSFNMEAQEFLVDVWIGSNDEKLYRINKDFHSVIDHTSFYPKFSSTREHILSEKYYWKYVDTKSTILLESRNGKTLTSNIDKKINDTVLYLENELHDYYETLNNNSVSFKI